MSRRFLAAAVVAAASLVTLDASVVIPTEFRQIVAASAVIVRGRVTDVRAVTVLGGAIDTYATVAVEVVIKGEAASFISVRVPGGQVGRYKWIVVGAPTFAVGDQAVFFLTRGPDNTLRPVGLSTGLYRLKSDPRSGRAMVDPPAIVGSTAWAGPAVPGDRRLRTMPVQEFESLVRFVMAAQGGPSKGGSR
jgi:hypothetical protein